MALFTKAGLRTLSNNLPYYRTATMLYESARNLDKNQYDTSVFLSHSHLDAEYVKDVVAFLRNRGINCYVDWMDETMPEKRAALLRQKSKRRFAQIKSSYSLPPIIPLFQNGAIGR